MPVPPHKARHQLKKLADVFLQFLILRATVVPVIVQKQEALNRSYPVFSSRHDRRHPKRSHYRALLSPGKEYEIAPCRLPEPDGNVSRAFQSFIHRIYLLCRSSSSRGSGFSVTRAQKCIFRNYVRFFLYTLYGNQAGISQPTGK
jgi:hypothetical protein